MSGSKRYAIVTPYYKEEKWLLERCIRSVHAQTVKVEHFMIADGHPQDWLDREPMRHLRLDREHRDFGNTPRTIGALLAVSEGYDGIGFLDADNWFENDHVAGCIAAAARSETCDYVIARRNLCRPDGSTRVASSCCPAVTTAFQVLRSHPSSCRRSAIRCSIPA
jgi:glycosyltransferase involved in cell wall biosynthesis